MTTEKKPKKQKLRNAEYYDSQMCHDQLYAKSRNGCVFKHLMELITDEENIKLAYRNMKKNSGSKTAGIDNKTIDYLAKWNINYLVDYVRKKLKWYVPQAIRRVEIPKGNGKTRPLGIPTIMDRLIQQCVLQVLEPICEAKFHERSNGFRPNRSAEHALAQCYKFMQVNGLGYVVDIDIKSFFDCVSHGKLLKQLWTLGIRDKKLICIISAMLKAEVAGIGFPTLGTPQGSLISPLLSNIVLNELDWWITSQWEEFKTHKDKPIVSKGRIYKDVFYDKLRQTSLKECYIVRYADDFKIFCRKRQDAVRIFHATKQWLKDRLGLDISEEKSKIINLKRQYSEFLGFKMKLKKEGIKRNGKPRYIVVSHMNEKSRTKIKGKSEKLIREIQKGSNDIVKGYEKVNKYNSFVIGVHNYYSVATKVAEDFGKFAFSVYKNQRARFHEHLKRNGKFLPTCIKERYGSSKQLRYVYGIAIAPIGYVQHRTPLFKRKVINKYTVDGRKEIHKQLEKVDMTILLYLMRNPVSTRSIEFNDNRLSVYCAQQGKCGVTGLLLEIGDIHTHHKLPISKGGTDAYKNLIMVSVNVHILIHAQNAETIAKYLNVIAPNKEQLTKINKLRNLALLEEINLSVVLT